jgi:signal transduction histidine kinase
MDHFVLAVAAGLCAVQMPLIAALLIERRRRRSAIRAVEQSEARYRGIIVEHEKREEERGQLVAARAAQEELREQDRRKDLFLTVLAHELRTPLNSIRMASELIRLAPNNEQRMREVIARQTDQLTRLVDDLLDVSRITQDKIQFRFEPVDLVGVVSQAVEAARPLFTEAGIQFSMSLGQRPVRVRGDAVRLAQVISNLLSNAVKFTPKEGSVSLTVDREGADVLLRIADNGVGIPQEMLGRVFDLFTQVDRSRARSQGGLGIGLTLVKRIVEIHGGAIDAESAGEGHGSCFTLRIPVLADQVNTPPELVAVDRVDSSPLQLVESIVAKTASDPMAPRGGRRVG